MRRLTAKQGQAKGQAKARYHHGELREALIRATRKLVEERGAENFTLADACRVAGVTTAAPYRHFQGKQDILAEIASRGFDELEILIGKRQDRNLREIDLLRPREREQQVERTFITRNVDDQRRLALGQFRRSTGLK